MAKKPPEPLEFPTSIRIPMPVKKAIDEEAAEQRRSRSWVIVEILEQWRAFREKRKKHKDKPVG